MKLGNIQKTTVSRYWRQEVQETVSRKKGKIKVSPMIAQLTSSREFPDYSAWTGKPSKPQWTELKRQGLEFREIKA